MRSVEDRAIVGAGLGQPIDVGADTLVAYAAKAGSQSFDGDGPNSPYATALLRHLGEPGLDVRIALGRVRDDVLAMTGGQQEPFIYGSLGGATIALVPPTAATTIEAPPTPNDTVPKAVPVAVPAAVSPTPPPAPAQAALDPAAACSRDEQRLAKLRAEPVRDQIVGFAKELACPRLRAQMQRLLESVGATDQAGMTSPGSPPRQQQAEASPHRTSARAMRSACSSCAPSPISTRSANLQRELACEQLRPQLSRLLESVGP
jgi:hypothetical protein